MLHVILVIAGLAVAASAMSAGLTGRDLAAGATSLALAVAVSARLGWLGRDAAFLPRLLKHAAALPQRLRGKTAGAFRVARAAISADVVMKPALIKVGMPAADAIARAEAAAAVSQAPGAACVTLAADAMLVHVLDEDATPEDLLRRRAGLPRRRSSL
jgi:multisubunit Na+/H+ antiporter MnhE subunit